jgi:hypothetical protein
VIRATLAANMHRPRTLAIASTVCIVLFGCQSPQERIESAPQNSNAQPGIAIAEHKTPNIDDADLVITHCGRPSSDIVLPIYDKMNNGPVRRIVFHTKRLVTVEFIPSHPITKGTKDAHHKPVKLPTTLPDGSVWRFDDVKIPKELDIITADRLAYFFPCGAKALHPEY